MGILNKIFAAGRAIQAGESLSNPATWKKFQLLSNAVEVLIGALIVFVPLDLTPEQITQIAGSLAIVAGAVNKYFTVATSDKLGLPNKKR
jgi:uncharacterized membrane protein HdeD (DUF308 family)